MGRVAKYGNKLKFRFAKDIWLSHEYTFAKSGLLTYDKFQHFMGGIVVSLIGTLISRNMAIGLISSAVFWFLWEVKDGILRWEEGQYITHWPIRYNWGGDGFSWKDMLAAWAGIFLLLIGDLILALLCSMIVLS